MSKRPTVDWEPTLKWLINSGFLQAARIPIGRVHFCLTREEKADICSRLNITHFVDDRLGVLELMTGVPNLFLYQPSERDRLKATGQVRILVADTWKQAAELIAASFKHYHV